MCLLQRVADGTQIDDERSLALLSEKLKRRQVSFNVNFCAYGKHFVEKTLKKAIMIARKSECKSVANQIKRAKSGPLKDDALASTLKKLESRLSILKVSDPFSQLIPQDMKSADAVFSFLVHGEVDLVRRGVMVGGDFGATDCVSKALLITACAGLFMHHLLHPGTVEIVRVNDVG